MIKALKNVNLKRYLWPTKTLFSTDEKLELNCSVRERTIESIVFLLSLVLNNVFQTLRLKTSLLLWKNRDWRDFFILELIAAHIRNIFWVYTVNLLGIYRGKMMLLRLWHLSKQIVQKWIHNFAVQARKWCGTLPSSKQWFFTKINSRTPFFKSAKQRHT
jgi:hypothetical protein